MEDLSSDPVVLLTLPLARALRAAVGPPRTADVMAAHKRHFAHFRPISYIFVHTRSLPMACAGRTRASVRPPDRFRVPPTGTRGHGPAPRRRRARAIRACAGARAGGLEPRAVFGLTRARGPGPRPSPTSAGARRPEPSLLRAAGAVRPGRARAQTGSGLGPPGLPGRLPPPRAGSPPPAARTPAARPGSGGDSDRPPRPFA